MLFFVISIIIQQYMLVILQNTFTQAQKTMTTSQLTIHLAERIMKLSIPNIFVWLLAFVAIFHHWLNILGEITRFADRKFYSDWWNSESISEYWRKWNLPIHNFANLHVYRPLVEYSMFLNEKYYGASHISLYPTTLLSFSGIPKLFVGQFVFLLSALAHEYLVSIDLI